MACNDDVLAVRLYQDLKAMSCLAEVRRKKRQLELSAIVLSLCACGFANHHSFLTPNMLFSFHHKTWRCVCSTLLLVTSQIQSCNFFGLLQSAGWRRANANSKAGSSSALARYSSRKISTFSNKQQRYSRRCRCNRSVRKSSRCASRLLY